jgi:hypothetical protein
MSGREEVAKHDAHHIAREGLAEEQRSWVSNMGQQNRVDQIASKARH